jgi:hypothetical protein
MFTRTFSVGKPRVSGRAVSLVLTLGLVMGALLLAGCPMEDEPSRSVPGLNADLIGTWEFLGPYGSDRYVITDTMLTYYSGPPNATLSNFVEKWAGEMVYADGFTEEAGIIIIEYTNGHKQIWPDNNTWHEDPPESNNYVADPLNPQPTGNFYGIYYNNLEGGAVGNTVFLSNTNDQSNNNGPTETETLEQAKMKFILGNMNNLIDLEAASPMAKK